jgi:hypothetical protein
MRPMEVAPHRRRSTGTRASKSQLRFQENATGWTSGGAEQLSHHPRVTAYHTEHRSGHIRMGTLDSLCNVEVSRGRLLSNRRWISLASLASTPELGTNLGMNGVLGDAKSCIAPLRINTIALR